MRKIFAVFLLMTVLLGCVGCASLQKKFTRKKPEKRVPAAIFIQEGPYQKKYSNEYYYKTHYTFWTTWHDEVIGQLGGNQKRLARAAQETLNHLSQMKGCLTPAKQDELKPELDELANIAKKIESGYVSKVDESSLRSDLEKIKRIVSSNFYYDKVKDSLLPDAVAL